MTNADTRREESDAKNKNEFLEPSAIADVVNFSRCEFFTDLRFIDKNGNNGLEQIPYKDKLSEQTVSVVPVMGAIGDKYEREVYDELVQQAERVLLWEESEGSTYNPPVADEKVNNNPSEGDIIQSVKDAVRGDTDGPIVLLQAELGGDIGEFDVWGLADLIVIWPTNNHATIRAFDIKAGEEKPHHQVQAGIYGILLENILNNTPDINSNDYTMTTGIIDGETDTSTLSPKQLPQFSYESAREDITRLLKQDGVIDKTFAQTGTPHHDLGKAAQESEYTQVYYMNALEERDIRLLGLTVGGQNAFRHHGLNKIEDVAELVARPQDKPRPYNDFPPIRGEHEEKVRQLNENPSVKERVQLIAQRAQNILGTLYPSHPYARSNPAGWEKWLQGSGQSQLPDDNPNSNYWGWDNIEIAAGGMIKVFIDLQIDYFEERVLMINAAIDCEAANMGSETVSAVIDEIPDDEDEYAKKERELMSNFVADLHGTLCRFDTAVDGETSPHFYFYTDGEEEHFKNAINRNSDKPFFDLFNRLLDLRGGLLAHSDVEQLMTSTLRPVIQKHIGLTEPGTSIPKVLHEIGWKDITDYWTHTRSDGNQVNVKNAFSFEFTSRRTPYTYDDQGTLSFDITDTDEPDGFCTTLPRFDAQLPLEYFWGAEGIDTYELDWIPDQDDDPQMYAFAQNFKYVSNDNTLRITKEDLEALGKRLATAMMDIEDKLGYCSTPVDKDEVKKKPINMDLIELDQMLDKPGDNTLKDGVIDYLDIEHATEREEIEALHKTPVRERILMGRTVPVEVTNVDGGNDLIEARLAYDTLQFDNPQFIEQACRVGSGERVLATQLRKQGGEYRIEDDEFWKTQKAPVLEVRHLDSSQTPNVLLNADVYDGGDRGYEDWNYSVKTSDSDEYGKPIRSGDLLVLDVKQMTIGRQRARTALSNSQSNGTYHLFDEVRRGGIPDERLKTDFYDTDGVEDFIEELAEANTDQNELVNPNEKQREFITKTDSRISLLQGPPGTGKTKGALAPTLLSRAHTRTDDFAHFRGLVTAPTHTAIDEVMEEVAVLLNECRKYDVGKVGNTSLVRITGSNPDPEYKIPGVTYVNYNDNESVAEFKSNNKVWNAIQSPEAMQLEPKPVIAFSTPQGALRFAKKATNQGKTEDAFANAPNLFDCIAVDEASMFTLPQLFMVGAFIEPKTSQYIFAGDHRQMPPVQHHEWKDERRFSVTETVPYLSALNYCRFLRGDTVERVERHEHATAESPEAPIAYTGLERTYRSHDTVTEFLREWVYAKDGINYHSEEDAVIDVDCTLETPELEAALTSAPLVLIAHDNRAFQQMNPTEADIAEEIVGAIPTSEEVGIVTPHNAQKALLRSRCENVENDVTVDTVERFQGGEKDAILISATVSDPEYLDSESDFILNPNRLNVALSRMKKKLVVIAPESLFEMIPGDKDEYEDAQIWKGLYQTAATGGPDATGTIEQNGNTTEFNVFTHYNE